MSRTTKALGGLVVGLVALAGVLALDHVLRTYGAHACVHQAKMDDRFDDLTLDRCYLDRNLELPKD